MLNQPTFVFWKLAGDKSYLNQLFARWENYGQLVFELSNGRYDGINILLLNSNVHILSISKKSKYVNIIELPNFYSNLMGQLKGINVLKRKFRFMPITLIIGEPTNSGIATLFIRKFISTNSKIQSQIHGDILPITDKTFGFLGFARQKMILFSVRRSDSIRVVSDFLSQQIKRQLGENMKTVVAPIPIDFDKIPMTHRVSNNKLNIGIVGRLHRERGLFESLEILKRIHILIPNFECKYIGGGKLENELRLRIKGLGLSQNIDIVKINSNTELQKYYSEMDILLSSAPSEGYGLAIREAALSGVMVIARKSDGVIAAAQEYPESMTIYSSIDEAVEIIENLELPIKPFVNLELLQSAQKTKDAQNLIKLFNSWI